MAVTALEITRRGPVGGGKSFGEHGSFEYLEGQVHFTIDPKHPGSRNIADIDLARRAGDGLVHYSADFYLIKPANAKPGGRVLYNVTNRGNEHLLSHYSWAKAVPLSGPPSDLSDGYLLRSGYTLAYLGWQIDLPPGPGMMRLYVPEAADAAGAPLDAPTFVTLTPTAVVNHFLLSDRRHQPWPARDPNDPDATLVVREHPDAAAEVIDRSQWSFGRVVDGKVVTDTRYVRLAGGFQPGRCYEVYYHAIGAPLVGLSFTATRDFISFLRHGTAGQGNPCAGSLGHALAFGASMSGRYLREFLYWGMNEDEQGRIVFDGMNIHTGSARRGEFNILGGQPSSNVSRAPGNTFPFHYLDQKDPITGVTDGILSHQKREHWPKIVATNSGIEYWWSGASLTHTDPAGEQDVEPPDNVRVYYMAGTHHFPSKPELTLADDTGFRTQHYQNTVDYTPILRAALANLDRWVREGVPAPPSQCPRISNGAGVRRETLEHYYRSLPGVGFPKALALRTRQDYGPGLAQGAPAYPPKEGAPYPTVVSSLDENGNDAAGVRLPDLRVPLGSYAGWNTRAAAVGGEGHQVVGGPLIGSVFPFAKTAAERQAKGDPRPSIDERYANKADYLAKVRASAQDMAKEGYLLAEDVDVVVQQAGERYDSFRGK